MHEKIADIQNSFWKAYKNFSKTLDANQWVDETGKILEKYRYERQYFYKSCKNLFYGWSSIICIIRVMKNEENGSEKNIHEKIVDIQNLFWGAYKNFSKTMNVNQWSNEMGKIFEKYRHDDNHLYIFCEDLLNGWTPMLSALLDMKKPENLEVLP